MLPLPPWFALVLVAVEDTMSRRNKRRRQKKKSRLLMGKKRTSFMIRVLQYTRPYTSITGNHFRIALFYTYKSTTTLMSVGPYMCFCTDLTVIMLSATAAQLTLIHTYGQIKVKRAACGRYCELSYIFSPYTKTFPPSVADYERRKKKKIKLKIRLPGAPMVIRSGRRRVVLSSKERRL